MSPNGTNSHNTFKANHHQPPSPWLRSHTGPASEFEIRKLVHFHLHRLVHRMFISQGQVYIDFMIRMAGDAFIIAGGAEGGDVDDMDDDIDLSASPAEIDARIRGVKEVVLPVFNEVKRAVTLLTQGYHIQPVVRNLILNMKSSSSKKIASTGTGVGTGTGTGDTAARVMCLVRDLEKTLAELGEVLSEVGYRTYPEGRDWTGVAELFDGTEVLDMYRADLQRLEVLYAGLLGKVARARMDGWMV